MTVLNKEKILEQAKIFADEGKYDRALREYEKIILVDASDFRVKLRMAELYAKNKQVNESIKLYREVADAYTQEGFFLKAVTVYKNILRLNPSLIEINEELAKLHEKMGIMPDAVRQFDIVAGALDRRGEIERVLEIRSKIVELAPQDIAARTKLAEVYQRQGKTDEALDQFQAILKLLEHKDGAEAKRIELYEKVLLHRPDDHAMIRALIEIYVKQGERRKALKWLESAKELTPYDPKLLRLQAEIYASLNQFETARSKFLALATMLQEEGKIEDAVSAYGEIFLMMPDESEKLREIVEEMKPGAFAELETWAEHKRSLMAEEAQQKEQTLQKIADEKRLQEDETRKAKEKKVEEERQEKIRRARGDTPSPAVKPASVKPVRPATPNAPVPQVLGPKPTLQGAEEAESAFSLGNVYAQMGLSDEASSEWKKAKLLFEELQASGKNTPEIAARLVELADKFPEEKVSPPPSPPLRRMMERKKADEQESLPSKSNKKISFV
ncbi:MAG: tetratricopeptide repeat protein [Deltaproteobacteria bacterium]|nr:tetratricopeptide repeat protein [Deltaproteobacteria bacterium]